MVGFVRRECGRNIARGGVFLLSLSFSCSSCMACQQCMLGPSHMLNVHPLETSEPQPGPEPQDIASHHPANVNAAHQASQPQQHPPASACLHPWMLAYLPVTVDQLCLRSPVNLATQCETATPSAAQLEPQHQEDPFPSLFSLDYSSLDIGYPIEVSLHLCSYSSLTVHNSFYYTTPPFDYSMVSVSSVDPD